jgi:hypothetical protein
MCCGWFALKKYTIHQIPPHSTTVNPLLSNLLILGSDI